MAHASKTKTKKVKVDLEQVVTDQMIALLEKGTRPWVKPWKSTTDATGGCLLPLRVNGVAYRGSNIVILLIAQMLKGYESNRWISYGAAKKLGGQVRKGEKATLIAKPLPFKIEDKNTGEDKILVRFTSTPVFNYDQCDNLEYDAVIADDAESQADIDLELNDSVESMIKNHKIDIRHGSNNACYVPSLDAILMPNKSDFNSMPEYEGTLLHEAVHWTGGPKRLDRIKSTSKRSKAYKFEELVAEIGSCITAMAFGIHTEVPEQSASYVANWLDALKGDKSFILDAAKHASKAYEYLTNTNQTSH